MKKITDVNVKGKRVLVRCDFNVSLNKDGSISDDLRIAQAVPTIEHLVKNGAKVILISHFKTPSKNIRVGEEPLDDFSESIYPVKERLSEILKKEVRFVKNCIGEKVRKDIDLMKEGDVLLLENVRMYKEEKEGSSSFAKELSFLADIFVNDAFSVSHRNHASVTKVPLYLPSFSGLLMEKEIGILKRVQKRPQKPVVAIIGGAKVESKISVVNYFLENADHVLLGGKIANMVLIVRGIAFNLPWPDMETEKAVKNFDYTSPKLHIPVDVISSKDKMGETGVREVAPGKVEKEEDIYDIGKETIKLYGEIIKEAKTIIWAGPLGLSEEPFFEKGTKEVGKYVVENKKALKIIGGGDTGNALLRFGILGKIDLISCGGGAMFSYMKNGTLPGIEVLKNITQENQK